MPDYPFEPVWQAFIKIRQWQQRRRALDLYNDPARRALLKPEAIWEVENGAKLSAFDVLDASIVRTAWSKPCSGLFENTIT